MSNNWAANVPWDIIHREMNGLQHGQKGRYKQRWCERLGISTSQFHRQYAARFGKQRRIEREPKVYTRELCEQAWAIRSELDDVLLKGSHLRPTTAQVIETMRRRGIVGPDELSESGLNAAWRAQGFHDIQARARIEAAYACHVFRLDFSRSELFQVVDETDDGDIVLKVEATEKHYKKDGKRYRAWVVQMIDDYSRAAVYRYMAASGESAMVGLEFLNWYLNRERDEHVMYRHLPEVLVTDNGSFGKDKLTTDLADRLGFEIERTQAGNSDSNGKVERGFRTLWRSFEPEAATMLREKGRTTVLLSELNELAHAWSTRWLERPHPMRRHTTRGASYQQSVLQRRVREVEADVYKFAFGTYNPFVDKTCLFTIEGVHYEAPPFAAGKRIRAFRNLDGEVFGELQDSSKQERFVCPPYKSAVFGSFENTRPKPIGVEVSDQVARDQAERFKKPRSLSPAVKHAPTTPYEEAKTQAVKHFTILEARAEIGRRLRTELQDDGYVDYLLDQLSAAGRIYNDMKQEDVDHITNEFMTAVSKRAAVG